VVCETFSRGGSFVHGLDPRVRVLAAGALSVGVALTGRWSAAFLGLAAGAGLVTVARVPTRAVARRLVSLNAFMLLLVALLPLAVPGEPVLRFGGLSVSREGLGQAGAIALKANAIVLLLTALLSTLELMTFGRALTALHVPNKLIHLYVFTVRYIDVLHHEYERLRRAMRVRCFRPRVSMHTYRSVGYLVGMLLVKSFDRSERIVAAMKCRGFAGRFVLVDRFALARRDAAFAAGAAAVLCGMGLLQWL